MGWTTWKRKSTAKESLPLIQIPFGGHVIPNYAQTSTLSDRRFSWWQRILRLVVLAFALWLIVATIVYLLRYHRVSLELVDIEQEFMSIPSSDKASDWLHYYTSQPHVAGSAGDKEQAEWTRDRLLDFGIPQVDIHTYFPLLNQPGSTAVSLVVDGKGERIQLSLVEDALDSDDTSRQFQRSVPAFHGYSANGNASGLLIFADYGRREDFDALSRRGVDLRGSVALVRYGRNFRGLKVRAAELAGCAGVLIYSDPRDDGADMGAVYPDGPWRPESSLQRGSVHYMSLYPGDPLTPGWPAHKGARRLDQEDAVTLPKIPSIPVGYRDARVLLEALDGCGFRLAGGDYWSGPCGEGGVRVEMSNWNEYKVMPIWNVMATIPGESDSQEEAEQTVYLGNHRDAWVLGAADPNSGSACMLEVARAFGALYRQGWRPRRTIVFASWDGEEYGMVGSTEFIEDMVSSVSANAVAYLNVDVGTTGQELAVSATPSLSALLRNVSYSVVDPASGGSLYDAWMQSSTGKGASPILPYVGQLGSGSDFVGFVDYAGVAAASVAFRGPYGVYHSNFDSYTWMTKFGDPGFKYHVAMAQYWGVIALRLAESELLPFDFGEYAHELQYYVEMLEKSSSLTFEVLRQSIGDLATAYDITRNDKQSSPVDINRRLIQAEREFLDPSGIPSRPWYRHVVYAPGLWAGYGAATLPTLSESLETMQDRKRIDKAEISLAYRVKRVAVVLAGGCPSDIERDFGDLLEYPIEDLRQ